MNATLLQEIAARIHGRVEFDVSLDRFTTYRIGGPARALIHPERTEDVAEVVQRCRETGTPWLALGLGSNMLVADAGFDGVVIRLGRGMDAVEEGVGEPEIWRVGAGLPTPRLARRTARAGLGGVHRLIGVPGTVGGGVYMNAGAHGQDFSRVVRAADVVTERGEMRTIAGRDIRWQYRSSNLESTIVTAATVRLTPADPDQLTREIRQHFRWRRRGTPFDQPCCGSVFRNPSAAGDRTETRTAGQLIDAAGLKGFTVGGAQVSPRHANYIVNVGGATAADVRAVIDAVRQRVLREFGVSLGLEVRLIGWDADGPSP